MENTVNDQSVVNQTVQEKPKKSWYQRWWVILIIAIVLIRIATSLFGSDDKATKSSNASTNQQQQTSAESKQEYTLLSNSEVADMLNSKSFDKYKGNQIKIRGIIGSKVGKDDFVDYGFRLVTVNNEKFDSRIVVDSKELKDTVSDITFPYNRTVEVTAIINKQQKAVTKDGNDTTVFILTAKDIKKIGIGEVYSPTKEEIKTNIKKEFEGGRITLHSIQFTDNKTRFIISSTTSNDKLDIYNFTIEQNGKLFEDIKYYKDLESLKFSITGQVDKDKPNSGIGYIDSLLLKSDMKLIFNVGTYTDGWRNEDIEINIKFDNGVYVPSTE